MVIKSIIANMLVLLMLFVTKRAYKSPDTSINLEDVNSVLEEQSRNRWFTIGIDFALLGLIFTLFENSIAIACFIIAIFLILTNK